MLRNLISKLSKILAAVYLSKKSKLKVVHIYSGLPHLSQFKIPRHFPDKVTFSPDNLFYFSKLKNRHLIVAKGNPTTYPGFLKGNSLTVIISRLFEFIFAKQIFT